jgi:cold shock CspA family protein
MRFAFRRVACLAPPPQGICDPPRSLSRPVQPLIRPDNMTQTGTVKKWLNENGFGFIIPSDGGDDIFVHHSDIHAEGFRSLSQGDTVEFIAVIEGDRSRAIQVSGPGGATVQGSRGGGGGGRKGGGDKGGGGGNPWGEPITLSGRRVGFYRTPPARRDSRSGCLPRPRFGRPLPKLTRPTVRPPPPPPLPSVFKDRGLRTEWVAGRRRLRMGGVGWAGTRDHIANPPPFSAVVTGVGWGGVLGATGKGGLGGLAGAQDPAFESKVGGGEGDLGATGQGGGGPRVFGVRTLQGRAGEDPNCGKNFRISGPRYSL